MKYPVFLMGLMGSGKTYWGKKLAQRLDVDFIDLDHFMAEKEGMSISAIFKKYGEGKFRELEARYLRERDYSKKLVIALGGGTPCYHENIDFIKNTGYSIYLQCHIDLIVERLYNISSDRPLIKGKNKKALVAFFKDQLAERERFYLQADKVVDGGNISENNFGEILNGP